MKRLSVLLVMCHMLSAGLAHGATYYVSKSGSDSNGCVQAQSVSTAKLTIKAGLSCITGGGNTLLIRGGTYNERLIDNIPSGTSWSNYVRIANYDGETVTLAPTSSGDDVIWLSQSQQFIEIDGINMDGRNSGGHASTWGPNVHDIRVKNAFVQGRTSSSGNVPSCFMVHTTRGEFTNLRCTGSYVEYMFYVAGDYNIIDGNEANGVSNKGIQVYSGSRTPTGNIVRNNTIHNINTSYFFGKADSRVAGILISGNNNQVYNNLIYDIDAPNTSGHGIAIYTGSGNKVWNNTIANSSSTGGIRVDTGASNTEVRNNIAYNNGGSVYSNSGSGTTESNNVFNFDPLFVDSSANNFRLRSASRAIDGGASLAVVTKDIDGLARPQGPAADIGAYEYQGQVAAPGPPAPPTNVRVVSN